jgi:aquaporin Z
MVLELLYTFALALVVLHVGTSDAIKDNYYYGVAIGLTIMAGVFTVGQITGGSFNPAVGLGSMIVDFKDFGDWNKALTFLGEYVLAPFVGAALAAVVYRLTALTAKK